MRIPALQEILRLSGDAEFCTLQGISCQNISCSIPFFKGEDGRIVSNDHLVPVLFSLIIQGTAAYGRSTGSFLTLYIEDNPLAEKLACRCV